MNQKSLLDELYFLAWAVGSALYNNISTWKCKCLIPQKIVNEKVESNNNNTKSTEKSHGNQAHISKYLAILGTYSRCNKIITMALKMHHQSCFDLNWLS